MKLTDKEKNYTRSFKIPTGKQNLSLNLSNEFITELNKTFKMNKEEHKQRHIELHKSLDELFADYISHHPKEIKFTEMPFKRLMEWSYTQTIKPTEINQ